MTARRPGPSGASIKIVLLIKCVSKPYDLAYFSAPSYSLIIIKPNSKLFNFFTELNISSFLLLNRTTIFIKKVAIAGAGEESSSFLRRLLALVGVFSTSPILSSEASTSDIGGSRGLLFLAADFNAFDGLFDGLFNGLFDVDLCVF